WEQAPPHSAGSEWVQVLRQGVVALREQSQLFRSTWQSKYGVVTTRGYFHVFRSQGDVVRGVPETSVFLPRARLSMVSAGTLQISAGGRFSRSRIVIQDGAASLANWRLLMESACFRRACPSGLASPPDSGAEEELAEHSPAKPSRRRSMAPNVACSPATPTPTARPFSADASMLAQTPALARLSQATSAVYTPTKNIYFEAYSPFSESPSEAPGSSSSSQDSESAPLSSLPRIGSRHALPARHCYDCTRVTSSADDVQQRRASLDIWHSDVLSMPDPARPRPRSMIYEPSSYAHVVLDPANPYLGDFLARHSAHPHSPAPLMLQGRLGHPRVVSQPTHASTPEHMSVGPCASTPRSSHASIPENPFEYEHL
ncbi:hypothetical protein GGI21_006193, partial [Coemansia aciculifera]